MTTNISEGYIRNSHGLLQERKCRSFEIEMLHKHGREFTGVTPHKLRPAPMGMCYQNARRLARLRDDEFRYVEGYAVAPGVPIPLPHAWCIDTEGRVADPTWHDGSHYFGIVFSNAVVQTVAVKTRHPSVLGNLWMISDMSADEIMKMVEDGVIQTSLEKA